MVQRKQTMRMLVFATHFYPYKGGLENYALQLASRLVKKGAEVDVVTLNDSKLKDFERINGINVYRIPCWNILGPVYSIPRINKKTKSVLNKLSKKKYDFVSTQTRFFATSWLGMRFARKHGIKLVHTEHGNVFVRHPNPLIMLFAWVYDMTVGRKIFKSSWKVIGVSKACCNFAKRMGAKDCTVIHNCVDSGLFKKKKTNLKSKIKISKKTKVITFVGRVIHAKGIQDLISALEGISNVKLLVVGEGPYAKKLKKISTQKGVDALFLGSKSQEQIVEILSITDIFINPSFSEGLPTSVLEAGAVGVPIIATDVGGTREIIDNNVNGLLVKPRDVLQLRKSLKVLLKDRRMRDGFAKSIRKKIEGKFDWEYSINKLIGTLKK